MFEYSINYDPHYIILICALQTSVYSESYRNLDSTLDYKIQTYLHILLSTVSSLFSVAVLKYISQF